MNKVFTRLAGIIGGKDETSTITVEITVHNETLHRGMVAARRLSKEDQEPEFMAYVVSRTGYINMKLTDFEVEP